MCSTITLILSILLRLGVAGSASYWLVKHMSHCDKGMK